MTDHKHEFDDPEAPRRYCVVCEEHVDSYVEGYGYMGTIPSGFVWEEGYGYVSAPPDGHGTR